MSKVYPGYVCSCDERQPICEKERAAMEAIKADSVAYERLKAKCRWEGMTLYGVLREWGDPRLWSDVVAAKRTEAVEP